MWRVAYQLRHVPRLGEELRQHCLIPPQRPPGIKRKRELPRETIRPVRNGRKRRQVSPVENDRLLRQSVQVLSVNVVAAVAAQIVAAKGIRN